MNQEHERNQDTSHKNLHARTFLEPLVTEIRSPWHTAQTLLSARRSCMKELCLQEAVCQKRWTSQCGGSGWVKAPVPTPPISASLAHYLPSRTERSTSRAVWPANLQNQALLSMLAGIRLETPQGAPPDCPTPCTNEPEATLHHKMGVTCTLCGGFWTGLPATSTLDKGSPGPRCGRTCLGCGRCTDLQTTWPKKTNWVAVKGLK